MDQRPTADIVRHFEGLTDPRTGNAKTHIFLDAPKSEDAYYFREVIIREYS